MSGIAWLRRAGTTPETWNPVRGCTRVSEGCQNCYAEGFAASARLGGPGKAYHGLATQTARGPRWTGVVRCIEGKLREPLKWRASHPRTCFVNSMGDLFHDQVPDDFLDRVFAVMALAPAHTFIILTKRSARMRAYLNDPETPRRVAAAAHRLAGPGAAGIAATSSGLIVWPLPNVWGGVSVENQAAAEERLPDTIAAKIAVRVASCEPLLGPLDLTRWLPWTDFSGDLPERHPGLDWAIVGGESEQHGQHARVMHPAWVARIQNDVLTAGSAYFFKQPGAFKPIAPVGATFGSGDGATAKAYHAAMGMRRLGLESQAPIMDALGTVITGEPGQLDDAWLFGHDVKNQYSPEWFGQTHQVWPDAAPGVGAGRPGGKKKAAA